MTRVLMQNDDISIVGSVWRIQLPNAPTNWLFGVQIDSPLKLYWVDETLLVERPLTEPAIIDFANVAAYQVNAGLPCCVRLAGYNSNVAFGAHLTTPLEITYCSMASCKPRGYAQAKRKKIKGPACESCHARRKKCDAHTPCAECTKLGKGGDACVRHIRKNARRIGKE